MTIRRRQHPKNGLAALRESRGLRLDFVARQLGVNQATMSRWERSDWGPSRLGEGALATFYGVSVEAIREAIGRAEA